MGNNLEHLETKYWREMIICHPELEEQCPWDKLGSVAWHDILIEHPEFISHAPKKISLSFLSATQWLEVLIAHPELEAYLPVAKTLFAKDSELIGELWGTLLSRHPEFAKYAPWKHLRNTDWKRVLSQQPQFIDNYEQDRPRQNAWQFSLTPNEQAEIIACQPSLFKRFKSEEFQGGAWETILNNQPQFRDRCNLSKIDPHCLGGILERHPEWLNYCDTYSMEPEAILKIAENFPEVLNHYELDNFKKIGGEDTPWIEKYPCLVPYTQWNFSYSYWDALLTNLSAWQKSGKRPSEVDQIVTDFIIASSKEVSLAPRKHSVKKSKFARPLPRNPKEKNLRNSIDSIMDYRYWVGLNGPIEQIETIPLNIRNILKDKDLTYEQLMIKMGMMSAEERGMVIYALFISDPNEFLRKMLEKDLQFTVQQVPLQVLLPLTIMYASSFGLYSTMLEISGVHGYDAIAKFRDEAGNNAWHYFFFRNPMYKPSRKSLNDELEYINYKFLADYACAPDTPNNMGFSYDMICQAMETYLKGDGK